MTTYNITEAALREMLDQAAESGARRALAELGLDDVHAAGDVREFRSLLGAYRQAKRTVWQTIVRFFTTALLAALLAGMALHWKVGQ